MNREPAGKRQLEEPFARSPHKGAARRVAVVKFEMVRTTSGSQSLSEQPRHGPEAARRGWARPAQSAKCGLKGWRQN